MTATLIAIGVFCGIAGMTVGIVIGGLLGATRQCAGCVEPDVPYKLDVSIDGETVARMVNREALGQ